MLPDQPPTFREPGPAEHPWTWTLLDDAESEAEVSDDLRGQRFATQADAESWVGEIWEELAEEGVAAVTLLEGDRVVYGPMSLSAG